MRTAYFIIITKNGVSLETSDIPFASKAFDVYQNLTLYFPAIAGYKYSIVRKTTDLSEISLDDLLKSFSGDSDE
jgi:hypothetical protein